MNDLNIDTLVGIEGDFYGVDMNAFKLGEIIYDVLEDEVDDYRSFMGEVQIIDSANKIFFATPLARVRVEHVDEVYRLVDVLDNHCWLEFGTNNTDDYYSYFVFYYQAKESKA